MLIYHKEYGDFNYFNIYVSLPHISHERGNDEGWGKTYQKVGFYAPTYIGWHKDEDCFSFGIQILGFGFSMMRQWSY